MKASEMLKKLQELLDKYGDSDIQTSASWGEYVEDIIFDSEYSGGIGIYVIVDRDYKEDAIK